MNIDNKEYIIIFQTINKKIILYISYFTVFTKIYNFYIIPNINILYL